MSWKDLDDRVIGCAILSLHVRFCQVPVKQAATSCFEEKNALKMLIINGLTNLCVGNKTSSDYFSVTKLITFGGQSSLETTAKTL